MFSVALQGSKLKLKDVSHNSEQFVGRSASSLSQVDESQQQKNPLASISALYLFSYRYKRTSSVHCEFTACIYNIQKSVSGSLNSTNKMPSNWTHL